MTAFRGALFGGVLSMVCFWAPLVAIVWWLT